MRQDIKNALLVLVALVVIIIAATLDTQDGVYPSPSTTLVTPAQACESLGYEPTDLDLARCADYLGLPCGNPYVDPLRPGCPEIGTALVCTIEGCVES
jgi:hypothetical protein